MIAALPLLALVVRLAAVLALAAPPSAAPLLPRDDLPGLHNFAQVAPGLYRSAQPTAEGMRTAKALGVRTVINLRILHSDRDELRGLGLRYAHIHAKAWHPEREDVLAFLAIATDPENQPVLVHCEHGADRTGLMVAAWRVAVEGWTPAEAAAELPRFDFHELWRGVRTAVEALDAESLRAGAKAARRPAVEVVP